MSFVAAPLIRIESVTDCDALAYCTCGRFRAIRTTKAEAQRAADAHRAAAHPRALPRATYMRLVLAARP